MLDVFKSGNIITGKPTIREYYPITNKDGIYRVIDTHLDKYEPCSACPSMCRKVPLMNVKIIEHKRNTWIDAVFDVINCDIAFDYFNTDNRTKLSKIINDIYVKEKNKCMK